MLQSPCLSLNPPGTLLPQGSCTCSTLFLDCLLSAICMSCFLISFKSLLKCHLSKTFLNHLFKIASSSFSNLCPAPSIQSGCAARSLPWDDQRFSVRVIPRLWLIDGRAAFSTLSRLRKDAESSSKSSTFSLPSSLGI